MKSVKHAIILMAGTGSRLGMDTPKGLLKIGEKRIIDYHLERLEDVPDVRVVVGFQSEKVVKYLKNVRKDITFYSNPNFATTTTACSLSLAIKDLKTEPYLFMTSDCIYDKEDFENFIKSCGNETVLGLTPSKSEDAICVAVNKDERTINNFKSSIERDYELGGIMYLKDVIIDNKEGYIYEVLEKYLPLKYEVLNSYEVDTKSDLDRAIKNLYKLKL